MNVRRFLALRRKRDRVIIDLCRTWSGAGNSHPMESYNGQLHDSVWRAARITLSRFWLGSIFGDGIKSLSSIGRFLSVVTFMEQVLGPAVESNPRWESASDRQAAARRVAFVMAEEILDMTRATPDDLDMERRRMAQVLIDLNAFAPIPTDVRGYLSREAIEEERHRARTSQELREEDGRFNTGVA